MNETIIMILIRFFKLIEGRFSQNFCKVFSVANIAGFLFSIACVEGPHTFRAIFFGIVCLLLACFFGSMVMLYEEVISE